MNTVIRALEKQIYDTRMMLAVELANENWGRAATLQGMVTAFEIAMTIVEVGLAKEATND